MDCIVCGAEECEMSAATANEFSKGFCDKCFSDYLKDAEEWFNAETTIYNDPCDTPFLLAQFAAKKLFEKIGPVKLNWLAETDAETSDMCAKTPNGFCMDAYFHKEDGWIITSGTSRYIAGKVTKSVAKEFAERIYNKNHRGR